jgi:hypothetical protein
VDLRFKLEAGCRVHHSRILLGLVGSELPIVHNSADSAFDNQLAFNPLLKEGGRRAPELENRLVVRIGPTGIEY